MHQLQLHPYLVFDGTCREAMNFYQQCLGGELMVQPFTGTPAAEGLDAAVAANTVLHASLKKDNLLLMASDAGMQPVVQGNRVSLSLQCTSEEEINRLFAQLSAGGTVTMPLERAFWGDTFGMFTDRFGIDWMLNFNHSAA
ncbi:VOC family protein [Hymenobacter aerilatus]|uniref:VOC family protein n=1 Tax=Hymenobacter aerilatus TaxID=2932251 RepID=A0A8T9SXW5_9BACT|nr:VOC family protein [Hymenobacter aerilatus]UOR04619.1 VOC family protein [Hymenobacter aerilatus]